jgi:glycine cleavage system H protein
MKYPEDYRYIRSHEWASLEGDTATIGFTSHAQEKLGVIVYVDLPKVGARVEAGGQLGSVESLTEVSTIHTPLSGEIIEINESLAAAPEKLNEDPHGAAWLVRLRVEKPGQFNELLTASEYRAWIGA